jgi:eukaryotic-like serine/threonine-protein kinase
MSPERWKKVEAIFNAALAFDSGEREDFVRRACGDDQELFNQVVSMLSNDESSESLFEQGVLGLLEPSTCVVPVRDENINRRIGVYRLIQELGRGGMGAVYLAERADGEFHQQVAVKLIKRGMDTDLVLRRFRHERQILANLNHSNIARLLDGGTTLEGLPYFVMEYIDGQSILKYCNEHKLSIKERLRLFLQICSAVKFAHQKTIIHRDIKPNNILVTKDGIAKLLDFGIAKILEADSSSNTLENPNSTIRMLTPDYASPEHAQGLPVTPVSDIYSLGVLLYVLLTDQHPYRSQSRQLSETEEVKNEKNAEKPSEIIFALRLDTLESKIKAKVSTETLATNRNTTVSQLHEELKGNLDSIVLKAINKNPNGRHQSVEQLIKEIEQHLEGKSLLLDSINLSPGLNQNTESANLSIKPKTDQNMETAWVVKKQISPRQKGIKQGVILMIAGIIGTPLIAFLSLELKLKPTWTLIFAVLTILGGIMRLGYALIFEESSAPSLLMDENPNLLLNRDEKERSLSTNHFISPAYWMEDSIDSIRSDEKEQDQKELIKNKRS